MTIVDRVWRWLYEVKDISLKTDKLLAFLWPWSNLLHSMIVDGKNKFLKNLWFVLKRGIFSAFLVEHNVRLKGSKLKKYRGCSLFKTLQKMWSFLYQRRTWKDSKLSSWYIFSFEEPLIFPVKAKHALY